MSEGAVPRPQALPVLPDGIPAALKELDRWVIWQYTWKQAGGKWDKPPRKRTGGNASVTRPTDWCSYEQALAAFRSRGFDGVGFVLVREDDLVGIDLDDCRDPSTGELLPWTAEQRESLPPGFPEPAEIACSLNSYIEVSPSGTGVKAIVRASVSKAARMGPCEIYPHGRYFTVTGHRLPNSPAEIREATEYTTDLIQQIRARRDGRKDPDSRESKSEASPRTQRGPIEDDDELLQRAFAAANGTKFRDLFEARWQAHFPAAEGPSEADLALCSMLAFWTDNDAARIDRLFRRAQLMRDKWDDIHAGDGRTYGQMTIEKSLRGTGEYHNSTSDQRQECHGIVVGAVTLRPGRIHATKSGKASVAVDVLVGDRLVETFAITEAISNRNQAVKLLRPHLGDQGLEPAARAALAELLFAARKRLTEQAMPAGAPTIADLLAQVLPAHYRFTHRDRQGLWSATLGQSVSRNRLLELVVEESILGQAKLAADAPRTPDGEVVRWRLIQTVEAEGRVVFANLMASLPTLEEATFEGTNAEVIQKLLQAKILEAWTRPCNMGILQQPIPLAAGTMQLTARASLADAIRENSARGDAQRWQRVHRGFSAWWRAHASGDGQRTVWLAMRFDLFGAVGVSVEAFGIHDQKALSTVGRTLGLFAAEPPVPDTLGHEKVRLCVLAPELTREIAYDDSDV